MTEKLAYSIPELLDGVIPVSRSKLYNLIRSGAFKTRRLGSRQVALAADVREFLDGLPPVPAKKAA